MHNASASKRIVGIIGLIVIVAAIGSGIAFTSHKTIPTATTTAPTTTAQTTTPATTSTTDMAATDTYKDGTYSTTVSYTNPGGNSKLGVSVTIKDDVVVDSTVTAGATEQESKEYQSDFISGYKALVVGKNIDQINLSRVSGASLTSASFNAALTQLKSTAKA